MASKEMKWQSNIENVAIKLHRTAMAKYQRGMAMKYLAWHGAEWLINVAAWRK
jgi:hypothetical protein